MDESQIDTLRTTRTEALDAADAIVKAAESDDRGLTPDEQTSVDEHIRAATEIRTQLEGLSRVAAARETLAAARAYEPPATQRDATPPASPEQPTRPMQVEVRTPEYERGDALGALICARTLYPTKSEAEAWAIERFGSGSPQYRALQQSTFTAGGALIAENFVGAELIELLRAASAVRRSGARMIPLVNGSATIPKITGGATASWGPAEGGNIAASEETVGQVVLVEKPLTCLVPFSNYLIRNADLSVTRMIRDDMVAAAANTEDLGFLRGTGISNEPKGVYNWVGTAGRTNSAGTSLANSRTDIRVALNRLGNNNAPLRNRAWFMHSRTLNYMTWDLVDGNSNFAFPALQSAAPSLAGAPVFVDNNISITLSTNQSEIYYAEMSECIIGDSAAMEVEIFANGAYVDSGGNLRSGISRNESVVRLIRMTDFGMRHTESAHVLEAVTYGA
jgi:HK97 family phage major capsid protein